MAWQQPTLLRLAKQRCKPTCEPCPCVTWRYWCPSQVVPDSHSRQLGQLAEALSAMEQRHEAESSELRKALGHEQRKCRRLEASVMLLRQQAGQLRAGDPGEALAYVGARGGHSPVSDSTTSTIE